MLEVVQLRGAARWKENDEEIIVGASADTDIFVAGDAEPGEDLVQGEAVMGQDGGCPLGQAVDVFDHGVDIADFLEILFIYSMVFRQRDHGFYRPAELAGDEAGDLCVGEHLGQEPGPALSSLGEARIITRPFLKMPGDVEGCYRTRFRQGGRRLTTGKEEGQEVDGIGDVDHSVGVDISSAGRGKIDGQRDPILVADADAGQEAEEEYEQDGQVFFHFV